jgi:hypothetical protein
MQSVEHLGQSWYLHGVSELADNAAFFRLPVPENPDPKQITYQELRTIFQTMIDDLEAAEAVLAKIESPEVKLPLHLFQFNVDFDGDGKISPAEDLTPVYGQFFGNEFIKQRGRPADTIVTFDYADVQWLRGYTHLIRAMAETILAYDEEPLWNVVSHRVFKHPTFHFEFMEEEFVERHAEDAEEDDRRGFFGDQNLLLDLIAGIHNLNFKLVEPERLRRAHQHLKQTLTHSRDMWDLVMAEMDDDHEWIPNQQQTSAVSLARISKEMVTTWRGFLDEVDAILDGKKLLPFWRGTDKTRGVNLRAVFHEPQDLDVILWVHGSGAVPFLENGDVTKQQTWEEFQRVYGGQLFSFGTWFN